MYCREHHTLRHTNVYQLKFVGVNRYPGLWKLSTW